MRSGADCRWVQETLRIRKDGAAAFGLQASHSGWGYHAHIVIESDSSAAQNEHCATACMYIDMMFCNMMECILR